jgi:hypothetical protein
VVDGGRMGRVALRFCMWRILGVGLYVVHVVFAIDMFCLE